MEPKYINELVSGERVESIFAVVDKQTRTTRAGKQFLSLKLSDKTGTIDAVVWENADALSLKFEKGDFIGVRADVGSYQGTNQLTLLALKKVEKTPEYTARFLPTAAKDVNDMAAELEAIAGGVTHPKVRELLMGFFTDAAFMERFKAASAAKGMHHVFAGGLVQHTLKVARLCDQIFREYEATDPAIAKMINRDLLVAGAIIHDIGKIEELSSEPGFDYTLEGRLVGHISLGLMTVKERIDQIEGFPKDAAWLLMHMLLAHHGENEYGSPKRPKCMEAFILHYADNLDAKLQGIMEFAEKDTQEGDFTSFHRLYDRFFYKGRPDMEFADEDAAG